MLSHHENVSFEILYMLNGFDLSFGSEYNADLLWGWKGATLKTLGSFIKPKSKDVVWLLRIYILFKQEVGSSYLCPCNLRLKIM